MKRMKYFLRQVEILLVSCLVVSLSILPVLGDKGPCETTTPGSSTDTIACVSGGCTGTVINVPQQKDCVGTDDVDCTSLPNDLMIIYSPKGG